MPASRRQWPAGKRPGELRYKRITPALAAHAAAGTGLPAAVTLLGAEPVRRAQALGPWRTRRRYERSA